MLKAFLRTDLIASAFAFAFAFAALYRTELAAFVSPEAAFSFACAAALRGLASARTALELSEAQD